MVAPAKAFFVAQYTLRHAVCIDFQFSPHQELHFYIIFSLPSLVKWLTASDFIHTLYSACIQTNLPQICQTQTSLSVSSSERLYYLLHFNSACIFYSSYKDTDKPRLQKKTCFFLSCVHLVMSHVHLSQL